MDWIDQYSGTAHRITTRGHHGTDRTARVKTFGDLLAEYECHPESKYADANGEPSTRQTVGLLQRRHVRIRGLKFIGKESNHLEAVESGVMHATDGVYTVYPDPRHDEWNTVVAALDKVPLNAFERATGKSRRLLIDARKNRRRPRARTRQLLTAVAKRLGVLR
jgi:hypothetical protein